ncbi:glycoside hydrolase family 28 protein [Exidia glandulosa HHB12029]|uniref:Glycoside hydrolase family 28 protein n=1 Tax=Exidia glandulosa HHB12029 TaxID=1314781 RepID=A0A165KU72_EXIGL|nr:glycoside hydrolase family 28 protein [Exidia glandulosa HHB12029]
MHRRFLCVWLCSVFAAVYARKTCVVSSRPDSTDDAPAIIDAFDKCGRGGRVVFLNQTYHVNSVMNTTGLKNCEVDLHGTLLWGTNITYWLDNSLDIGYQNQSSAWFFGGENVVFRGHGHGTLDGNGQVWYDFVNGQSNYPRRPHAITIWGAKDSLFEGLRFVQSQMWTMTVIHSQRVLLRDIYVNSTSHSGAPARNTDGADTMFSDSITFDKFTIDNGDDSIALKANSTNIVITNSTFYRGLGVAIGSIGQYEGAWETIENLTASNIVFHGMRHAAYVKTWTGQHVGDPPNGGGGGLGLARNLTFTDFTLYNNSGVFAISQCTTFSGAAGDCNSSHFQLSDLHFTNVRGTVSTPNVALLQCSAAAPCSDIEIEDVSVVNWANGTAAAGFLCSSVKSPVGFECTGPACDKPSSTAEC